jgi:hypothetical protein
MRVLTGPRSLSAVRPQIRRAGIPMAFIVGRMVREVSEDTLRTVLLKVLI